MRRPDPWLSSVLHAPLATLPLWTGCALHVGATSSVLRAPEPVELGEGGSELAAGLRGYELVYQVQVPFALTYVGATILTGDARARETGSDTAALVRSAAVGGWHAQVGLAVPLPEVKGLRFAPYGAYSRRFLSTDEPAIASTTEVGLQILPREPWGFFESDMRQGFAARVGLCWAQGEFGDATWGNPPFAARGLMFAIDYRFLFAEVEKWEL